MQLIKLVFIFVTFLVRVQTITDGGSLPVLGGVVQLVMMVCQIILLSDKEKCGMHCSVLTRLYLFVIVTSMGTSWSPIKWSTGNDISGHNIRHVFFFPPKFLFFCSSFVVYFSLESKNCL